MNQVSTPIKPLNKQDVAAAIGCSVRNVEILVKSGELPQPAHIGRRVFWHPEIFYSWLDARLRHASPAADFSHENIREAEQVLVAKPSRRIPPASVTPITRMKAKQAAFLASI